MPNLFVMAGPNGAGKTTTSRLILTGPRTVAEFVNADIIAAEERLDDIAAGRRMLTRLDELAAQGKDIAFETTLSSASMRKRIEAMRGAGYLFHLIYVWLPSPEMSIARVAARVRAGGHHIPEEVIRRRYPRSLKNLFDVFAPLADAWLMIDNSRLSGPLRMDGSDARLAMPFTMDDIEIAARRAVEDALRRHKARGESAVIWRNGRVAVISPEEIDI